MVEMENSVNWDRSFTELDSLKDKQTYWGKLSLQLFHELRPKTESESLELGQNEEPKQVFSQVIQ